MRILSVWVESGVFNGHLSGGHGELEKAVCATGLLVVVEPWSRVKVDDFTTDLAVVVGGIHGLDGPDATLPREGILPEILQVVPDRGEDSDAGDDDATFKHVLEVLVSGQKTPFPR
jgi:hypothetical protein